MKTTYLVWKDPSCGGTNVDWQEISGKEFLALVRAKTGRHFIKLDSTEPNGSDGVIVMESTKQEYVRWRKEKDHGDYVREHNPGYVLLSYHAMETEDGCYGEELLCDEGSDVETECFRQFELETFRDALARLSDEERNLIEYLYLLKEPGSVRGYEKLTGISKSAVNRRQIAALIKLKNFLSE